MECTTSSSIHEEKRRNMLLRAQEYADHAMNVRAEASLNHTSLFDLFVSSCSSYLEERKEAMIKIEKVATIHPQFNLELLRVIALASGTDGIEEICSAAVAKLKVHILRHRKAKISSFEKEYLKTLILCMKLSISSSFCMIQSSLDESLQLLSDDDGKLKMEGFYHSSHSWHQPLLELLSKLQEGAVHVYQTGVIVNAARSIIQRLTEHQYEANLFNDVFSFLHNIATPVLDISDKTAQAIESFALPSPLDVLAAAAALSSLFHTKLLCCRILGHVQSPSEDLSSPMNLWKQQSVSYLVKRYPLLEGEVWNEIDETCSVNKLRLAICEVTLRLLRRNFHESDPQVVYAVICFLLDNVSKFVSSVGESLVTCNLNFILTINFSDDRFWESYRPLKFLSNLIVPNLVLTDYDEEMFDTCAEEFMKIDMLASDSHGTSRRGLAYKLLEKLRRQPYYLAHIIFMIQIEKMLKDFAEDPVANWKSKDCAIRLAIFFMTADAEDNIRSLSDLFPGKSINSSMTAGAKTIDTGNRNLWRHGCSWLDRQMEDDIDYHSSIRAMCESLDSVLHSHFKIEIAGSDPSKENKNKKAQSILEKMRRSEDYALYFCYLFESAIVAELQSENVNEFPMLKAAALKFCYFYADKLPTSSELLHILKAYATRFLHSDSSVVQSYASRLFLKICSNYPN